MNKIWTRYEQDMTKIWPTYDQHIGLKLGFFDTSMGYFRFWELKKELRPKKEEKNNLQKVYIFGAKGGGGRVNAYWETGFKKITLL